jgi:hypothetical protein
VQCLIAAHKAGVSSEEKLQEEPSGPEPLRPVTGVINELSTNPDASGRYVCLAQEPVTPWPHCPRPGKENDGEAVSASRIAQRTSSGLMTPLRSATRNVDPFGCQNAPGKGAPPPSYHLSRRDVDMLFRDSRNYPYGSGARAGRGRQPPPQRGPSETHTDSGTVANGTTVAPALDIRAKEVKTPVNATWMAPAPA